jgi:hypothetical protein
MTDIPDSLPDLDLPTSDFSFREHLIFKINYLKPKLSIMAFKSRFTTFCLILEFLAILGLADQAVAPAKRSALLEKRQQCQNPDWIPACPGKLSLESSKLRTTEIDHSPFKWVSHVYLPVAYAAPTGRLMSCRQTHVLTGPNLSRLPSYRQPQHQ